MKGTPMMHLITGGSGFIGAMIARRLRERGDQVRVLDIVDDRARPQDIEFIQGDTQDGAVVARAMRGVDIVHHNAALVAQAAAGRRYWDVNLTGTTVVAEQAAAAGVKHVVHLSTTAVIGMPPMGPITADTIPMPIEDYGKSKLAGERAMQAVCESAGIPLVTIRPRVTLGAGRLGIFHILFDWIRDGRNVYVFGDGSQRLQFIHVHDLMDFYMLALENGRPGVYNVGTNRFGSLREDLEALIAYAGSPSKVRGLPVWPAIQALRILHAAKLSPLTPWHYKTYHRDCYFDTTPLAALGWEARYSNIEMLRESYDAFVLQSKSQSLEGPSPHRRTLAQGALRLVKVLS
jgi:nucleoside-diphosphate-sugar epimerase